MGKLSVLFYSVLTLVIFLCLHRQFWAQLKPAGSQAANHMPFYTRNLFFLSTCLQLLPSSDFLIFFWHLHSISTSAAYPFALVNISFQVSWTQVLYTLLGYVHATGYGDIQPISSLDTSPASVITQPLNVPVLTLQSSNDYFVIPQSMCSP